MYGQRKWQNIPGKVVLVTFRNKQKMAEFSLYKLKWQKKFILLSLKFFTWKLSFFLQENGFLYTKSKFAYPCDDIFENPTFMWRNSHFCVHFSLYEMLYWVHFRTSMYEMNLLVTRCLYGKRNLTFLYKISLFTERCGDTSLNFEDPKYRTVLVPCDVLYCEPLKPW